MVAMWNDDSSVLVADTPTFSFFANHCISDMNSWLWSASRVGNAFYEQQMCMMYERGYLQMGIWMCN